MSLRSRAIHTRLNSSEINVICAISDLLKNTENEKTVSIISILSDFFLLPNKRVSQTYVSSD